MRLIPRIAAVALAALLVPTASFAKLRVAASTTDLASIAATVGGDQVETFAIARPNTDPHRVEVLPSYMVKVSRANVYLKIGLGLDQWADGIIAGSRNQRVKVVDCSQGVNVLEVPTGKVTAAMGDVHPNGNPHYWLDPRAGAQVAKNIAEGLATADPAHASEYRKRAESFGEECETAWKHGREMVETMPARVMLSYHRSWTYLGNAFGIEIVATIEPVPGIPPTARHLAKVVETVKARHVPVLVEEPYFSDDAGKFLARQTGIRVVVASAACDSPAAGSYLAHINDVLRQLGGSS